jgi:hypothetical protein
MMTECLQTGQQRARVLWPWLHVEPDALLPHGVPLLRGAGPPGCQDQPHRHARRGIPGNKKQNNFYSSNLVQGLLSLMALGELSGCTKISKK